MTTRRISFLLLLSVVLNGVLFARWRGRAPDAPAVSSTVPARSITPRQSADPRPLRRTLRKLQGELKDAQEAHPDPIPVHDLIPPGWVAMPPFWKKSILHATSLTLRSTYVKNLGVTASEKTELERIFRQHFRTVQDAEKRGAIRTTMDDGTQVVEVSPAPDAFAQFLIDCANTAVDLLGKKRGHRIAQHLLAGETLWPIDKTPRRQLFVTSKGEKVRLVVKQMDEQGNTIRTNGDNFNKGVATSEHYMAWRYGHLLDLDQARKEVERALP